MTCSNYDWNAYTLGELDLATRREAETHAATCPACREELAHTRLTLDALSVLREVDPPRRIAFVSDKIFEPGWWEKCRQMFRAPSFAGALVIAAAILVHGWARPALDQREIQAVVARAVADTQMQYEDQMKAMLTAYEEIQKQNRLMYMQNTGLVRQ